MAISLYSFIFAVTLAVCTEAGPLYNYGNTITVNFGGDCGTVIASGLNVDQINEIVNAHIANNRGPLTWSNEVAAVAQKMANQCGTGSTSINWNGSSRFMESEDSIRDVSFTNMVNSMFQPRPTWRMPTFTMPTYNMPSWRMPDWSMPTWTMPTVPDVKLPEVTLPEINVPEINVPEINVPQINWPEINWPEMHFPKTYFPEMNSHQTNFPHFSMSSNWPSRHYRDLSGDYTNMMGCGFVETQKGSNFSKRLICLYGPQGNSYARN